MKNIGVFLYSLIFINTLSVIIIVLLERKRPEKTIAWLLVIVLLPPIGLFMYIFLGRDWKIHKLNKDFSPKIKQLINKVINKIDDMEYIPLIQLLVQNSESPLFIHNDITIFGDGLKKFNKLKEEIAKAKHHIHLEYYIVKNDTIGNEIKDLLIKKSLEGVSVKFIIDRVGSIKLGKQYINDMLDAGINVVQYSYFLAPLVRKINTQINYRNHRKIVVIDGTVGFIGGINIGDEYLGKGKLGYWRDTHLMIKGDFVLGLQGVFIDDFMTIKKANDDQVILDEDDFFSYFPKIHKKDTKIMQLIKSGPDSPYPSIMQGMLKMINMAKKNIYITTPYFVPPESIMDALKISLLSGVDVRILFPGKYDHFIVYYASKTYLAELIKCGAKVYLYDDKSFIHAKVMTIDGKVATVGTANMDIRSYELNYEINAVIYDEPVTTQLDELFFEDLKNSVMLTEKQYDSTPFLAKSMETVARLFSSLL
ncbi:cardiolipin synthase [Clostridium sp. MSJ-11]|uniref:Cardiolipin synthase n=1 Tax=Clostridium mobile TaxID=2841512 RepID=A0ABS6EQ76_9CLOT|nr:cardiolipin synthase [Clostridium mobile]MBU5486550.1 cardiolipin synthase [Clostridium mobile]